MSKLKPVPLSFSFVLTWPSLFSTQLVISRSSLLLRGIFFSSPFSDFRSKSFAFLQLRSHHQRDWKGSPKWRPKMSPKMLATCCPRHTAGRKFLPKIYAFLNRFIGVHQLVWGSTEFFLQNARMPQLSHERLNSYKKLPCLGSTAILPSLWNQSLVYTSFGANLFTFLRWKAWQLYRRSYHGFLEDRTPTCRPTIAEHKASLQRDIMVVFGKNKHSQALKLDITFAIDKSLRSYCELSTFQTPKYYLVKESKSFKTVTEFSMPSLGYFNGPKKFPTWANLVSLLTSLPVHFSRSKVSSNSQLAGLEPRGDSDSDSGDSDCGCGCGCGHPLPSFSSSPCPSIQCFSPSPG